MHLGQVFVLGKAAHLLLEVAKPLLHETVSPGTGFGTAAQGNLRPLASKSMLVAEMLAALVGVEDRWGRMLAEGV